MELAVVAHAVIPALRRLRHDYLKVRQLRLYSSRLVKIT